MALLPQTQQRSEVRVRGNHYPPFDKGRVKDDLICDVLQPSGAKMDGVVSGSLKDAGNFWRERVVDQELHPAERSGSSRSRTASAAKRRASMTSSASRSG